MEVVPPRLVPTWTAGHWTVTSPQKLASDGSIVGHDDRLINQRLQTPTRRHTHPAQKFPVKHVRTLFATGYLHNIYKRSSAQTASLAVKQPHRTLIK